MVCRSCLGNAVKQLWRMSGTWPTRSWYPSCEMQLHQGNGLTFCLATSLITLTKLPPVVMIFFYKTLLNYSRAEATLIVCFEASLCLYFCKQSKDTWVQWTYTWKLHCDEVYWNTLRGKTYVTGWVAETLWLLPIGSLSSFVWGFVSFVHPK